MIRARRARIVATIGPASRAPEKVRELAAAGADVFRVNFSHGAHVAQPVVGRCEGFSELIVNAVSRPGRDRQRSRGFLCRFVVAAGCQTGC